LQLTNILRDLDEDSDRGRLYLPRESLEKNEIREVDPHAVLRHPGLEAVCEEVLAVANEHFRLAENAMSQCTRAAMRPARLMCVVYREILRRLSVRGWRERKPVRIPGWRKVWLLIRHGIV
jgi:phytoene synthase